MENCNSRLPVSRHIAKRRASLCKPLRLTSDLHDKHDGVASRCTTDRTFLWCASSAL